MSTTASSIAIFSIKSYHWRYQGQQSYQKDYHNGLLSSCYLLGTGEWGDRKASIVEYQSDLSNHQEGMELLQKLSYIRHVFCNPRGELLGP